jgi:hypothetical protein
VGKSRWASWRRLPAIWVIYEDSEEGEGFTSRNNSPGKGRALGGGAQKDASIFNHVSKLPRPPNLHLGLSEQVIKEAMDLCVVQQNSLGISIF